jgi:hypothetical protein
MNALHCWMPINTEFGFLLNFKNGFCAVETSEESAVVRPTQTEISSVRQLFNLIMAEVDSVQFPKALHQQPDQSS